MIDKIHSQKYVDFARAYRRHHSTTSESFAELAQDLTEEIYKASINDDGLSDFALVRLFRICKTDELPPSLLAKIDGSGQDHWTTLMGTYGDEPEWCSRQLSMGHQVFPADADFTPMLKAAFIQLDIVPGAYPPEEAELQGKSNYKRFLHIETAKGSPSIPAQDFVETYGIQSLFGLGMTFVSGASYFILLFSKAPIDRLSARSMSEMGLPLGMMLNFADSTRNLW